MHRSHNLSCLLFLNMCWMLSAAAGAASLATLPNCLPAGSWKSCSSSPRAFVLDAGAAIQEYEIEIALTLFMGERANFPLLLTLPLVRCFCCWHYTSGR